MKNLLSLAALWTMILLCASCQKEITSGIDDGGVKVSFTVQTGDQQTRAIADASNIDILHWEIYGDNVESAQAAMAKGSVKDEDKDGVFTLDLSVILDQTYHFIFWAQVDREEGTEHYDVSDLRKVRIKSYDDEFANDESRAAFFAYETIHVAGSIDETITLYRPFAQLNLGTETYDISSLNMTEPLKVNESEVKVYGVAHTFNTLTGMGEGDMDVVFAKAATPNGDADAVEKKLEVANDAYYWIGMNYLIVNDNADNVKVDMTFHTTHGKVNVSVDNVPVKENYRTNIIGDLLTSGAVCEVVIDENFQQPDIIVGDEGGSTEGGETPIPDYEITQDGNDLIYTVYTPEGLQAWREAAHQDALDDTERKVILVLGADITLDYTEGQANWIPVGTYDHPYDGYVDGAGHYISDMSIETDDEPAGFIGAWTGEDGAVAAQNLTFRNVHIISSNDYGTGTVIGYGHKNFVIKNCHVKGGSISGIGGGPCGGLFGGGFGDGFGTGAGSGEGFGGLADGCSNSASVITSTITYYVGGIGGYGNAINCTNTGVITGSGYYIGGILGGSNGQVSGNKNHGKVTGSSYVGGIVGGIEDGTLENNYNYGDVYGAEEGTLGGIFGFLDGSTTQSGNIYECIVKVIVVDRDYTVKKEDEVTTYTVYTAEGLEIWRAAAHQNALDKKSDKVNLLLAADIELPAVEEGNSNWTPVGTSSAPYNGVVDGADFTISNLTITGASNIGFIGSSNNSGVCVKKLKLADVNISGTKNVAAVVGNLTNNGNVDDCHVLSGKVTGTGNHVGGILGYSEYYGGAKNCSNAADITGASYVAGISGHAYATGCTNRGNIIGTGSYVAGVYAEYPYGNTSYNQNYGDITGLDRVAGITGHGNSTYSHNEGNVTGRDNVSGITSENSSSYLGNLGSCTNKGNISGRNNVAGIISNSSNSLADCKNEGNIEGEQYVAGIAAKFSSSDGYNKTALTRTENSGKVTGIAYVAGIAAEITNKKNSQIVENVNSGDITGEDRVAAFVAYNQNASVTNNTNSGDISGFTNIAHFVATQNPSYSPDTVTGNVSTGSLNILKNNDYDRTVDGKNVSYIVYTQKGFETWVAEAHKSVEEGYACDLTLETDIVLPIPSGDESNWTPIGNYTGMNQPNNFTGKIDGKNHTISNLTIKNGPKGTGFIGYITSGYIKNLNFINADIKGDVWVGVIAGYATVPIENCHVLSGSVYANTRCGGIAAYCSKTITGCKNYASISDKENYASMQYSRIGGIVGSGNVVGCENYGAVTGSDTYIGGCVGSGEATDSKNYAKVTYTVISTHVDTYIGGVIGSGNAKNCINTGDVVGIRLVGGITGSGDVTDCNNSGNVNGTANNVGGCTGAGGAVSSSNSGTVSGKTYVGGVSGSVTTDIVSDCQNSGTVIATGDYAGGIAGRHTNNSSASKATEFTGCENTGDVTSDGNYVGGIVGESNSGYCTLTQTINRGKVSGNDYVGGIAGSAKSVTDSYNYAEVTGKQNVAGIAGAMYDAAHTISGSENKGVVTGISYLGGIVGFADAGTVTDNTHSGKVSGQDKVGGIVGYNEEAVVTYNTHAGEAEALTNVAAIVAYQDPSYSPDIVTGNVDNGTETILAATDYTREVNGSDIYYKVYSASGLLTWMQEAAEGASSNSKIVHLELMADITLPADAVWAQIGNSSRYYKGNVNGNNHTISKFTITNGLTHAGFIGALDGGTVKNLKFADVSITSTNNYGAVIVGTLRSGTVENCHVLGGTVTIGPYSGGLVGNVSNKGASILNCSNAAAIYSSKQYAGGIVGYCSANSDNRILIDGCVNTGIIHSTSSDVAGIVGCANYTDISNCSNKSDLTAVSTTGGIVGDARYSTITYCINIGNVTSTVEGKTPNSNNVIAGGIAGSVSSSTTVSSNANKGTVTAYYNTGGIVGKFTSGMVSANTNEGNVRYVRNSDNGLIVGKHSGGTIADDNIAGGSLIKIQ